MILVFLCRFVQLECPAEVLSKQSVYRMLGAAEHNRVVVC